jgi:hypothetical protein
MVLIGAKELILLQSTSVHVQLPCLDHFFEVDMAVTTPHLHDEVASNSEIAVSAYLLRVFDVRNRILQ